MATRDDPGLFPALLRHWRTRRGLSQLDLALAADVSSRHVSFLETGRAQPSREMVLRLGATLDVPLRDQNTMLGAAGFPAQFTEPALAGLPDSIAKAIERMLEKHEPLPMLVVSKRYDILTTNRAAASLLPRFIAHPEHVPTPPNLMHMLFDPRLARRFVVDWERVGRALLSRLHREALSRPSNPDLGGLVRSLLEYPDVPESFRHPDFSTPSEPTLSVRLRRETLEVGFLTTVTVFSAPQNITLDEVMIESYFPLDERTMQLCDQWAGE